MGGVGEVVDLNGGARGHKPPYYFYAKLRTSGSRKIIVEQRLHRIHIIIKETENFTVKKTLAGTDQTTRNRVQLRYFDRPIPVFIRFIEISRIYRNIYEVK